MVTVPYAPRIGGIETVVRLYTRELKRLGHEVRVVTAEPADSSDPSVVRQPSVWRLWPEYSWADVVLLHGPTVRLGWPALLRRRPTHLLLHIPPDLAGPITPSRLFRRWLTARCSVLTVSDALGRWSGVTGYTPLPNPYDDELYHSPSDATRDRDVVFVGRLVPIKGVLDLVDAMGILAARGRRYTLTVVGGGPEADELARRVQSSGLGDQVCLAGRLPDPQLSTVLRRHRVIAIPSKYPEAFGVVAMEGIAAGCVAVGADSCGLPEAIGPCGVTFPMHDVAALADSLERVLETPGEWERLRAGAADHIAVHTPAAATARLLAAVQS
jgi:glycogen synthase